MEQVSTEVRAPLQERQDARKARLDPGRRDVQFVPGDLVLLDVDRIPLPSRGLLSPRWQGPFSIVAQTAPNTYKLTLPAAWKVVNEFNVSRLRRYRTRPEWMWPEQPAPPPVVDPVSGVQEHEVHEILRFRLHYGKPQCLVRWTGRTRRATHGNRWSTSPTAKRRFGTLRRRAASRCHGRRRRALPRSQLSHLLRTASRSRRRPLTV